MFVAAVEEGTFTAAAARENSTQSGVSQHIRHIEDVLGVPLFARAKTGVTPTPAAVHFYARCIEMLRMHEEAIESARGFASGLAGDATIGLMPTLTQFALAPALEIFTKENTNVNLLVVEGYSGALTDSVLAGQLDAAFIPATGTKPGLRTSYWASAPEVLITARRAGQPSGAPVRLSEVGSLKLIVPSPANVRRQLIESYCEAHCARVDRLLELDSVSATLDLVAKSDWRAILPLPAVADPSARLRVTVQPLAEPSRTLEMAIVSRASSSLSPAVLRFGALLAESLETIMGEQQSIFEKSTIRAAI